MAAEPSDEEILTELVHLAREDPARQLLQFGGAVSARQYLPLYRAVRRFVPHGAQVLDWGSGNGHFSYFLLRSGYQATGFALDATAFEEWLPKGEWEMVRGDRAEPTRLPFPDAAFDAVSSVGVLEHVHEVGGRDRDSLTELSRVLREGGTFVCCHLPNRNSWIEWLARRMKGRHQHSVRYSPDDVARLFQAAGLEILELERYAFLPRNLWAAMPPAVADAWLAALVWDGLDRLLATLLPMLCQNFLVVARKRSAP